MPDLAGDGLDGLHTGGAGADHGNALASKIHRLLRPTRRMEGPARKRLASFDARQGGGRERADRGDQEAGANGPPVLERDGPAPRLLGVVGRGNPALEGDIAAQIEFVGDVIEIAQRFRLAGKVLGPLPFIQQLLREGIAVGIALGIETCAGVAVPEPGAADIGPGLEHPHPHSQLAQPVELVEAGHARANDDGIVIENLLSPRALVLKQGYPVPRPRTNPVSTRGRVAGLAVGQPRSALLATASAPIVADEIAHQAATA